MSEIHVATVSIIKLLLKDSQKTAEILSEHFYPNENETDRAKAFRRIISIILDCVDDASSHPFCMKSSKEFFKIILFVIIVVVCELFTYVRKFIGWSQKTSRNKMIDLPEEYIGEMQALERRWQRQGLSDEEIQVNIKFLKRDMQRGHIKRKMESFINRIKLQIGQYLV